MLILQWHWLHQQVIFNFSVFHEELSRMRPWNQIRGRENEQPLMSVLNSDPYHVFCDWGKKPFVLWGKIQNSKKLENIMCEGSFLWPVVTWRLETLGRNKMLFLLCWLWRLNAGHCEKADTCFQSSLHTRKQKTHLEFLPGNSLLFICAHNPFQIPILTDSWKDRSFWTLWTKIKVK